MKSIIKTLVSLCLVIGVAAGNAAWAADTLDAAPRVNINEASAEELAEALNGVGITRAQAIVRSRDNDGPFSSAEGLSRVKGVGDATVEKNRERIELK
ncbi:MAG: helix-hairpin-helix domain-containing protein [Alcanivoracaceae bacterium]|jgi:competence protein ComEA|nr:helix-hairpin-helix domain-containing protein [Alcanivoracaceae bacterium]